VYTIPYWIVASAGIMITLSLSTRKIGQKVQEFKKEEVKVIFYSGTERGRCTG